MERNPERLTVYINTPTLTKLELCTEKLRIPRATITRKAIETYVDALLKYEDMESESAKLPKPERFHSLHV